MDEAGGIGKSQIANVLHAANKYLYRDVVVSAMSEEHRQARLRWCIENQLEYWENFLVTEPCNFTTNKGNNRQNRRMG